VDPSVDCDNLRTGEDVDGADGADEDSSALGRYQIKEKKSPRDEKGVGEKPSRTKKIQYECDNFGINSVDDARFPLLRRVAQRGAESSGRGVLHAFHGSLGRHILTATIILFILCLCGSHGPVVAMQ
jgi:hypothetical protein